MPIEAHALTTLVGEMRRLKALGDKALVQVTDPALLNHVLDPESNSIAIIVKHVAGNMRSRWTDFLSSDGEKPNRDRDGEFDQATNWTHGQLTDAWESGWRATFEALDALTPEELSRSVTIRESR